MTRQPSIARRAEQLLGRPVVSTAPIAGGDVATATKLRLNDGTQVLMKSLSAAPAGLFEAEARGLRWLAEAAALKVPEVLAVEHDCLILPWVEQGRAGIEAVETFGRALAALHAAGADGFGAEQDGYIAKLPLPNRACGTWAEFYAVRRVLPYLKLARDRGTMRPEDVTTVETVVGRLSSLIPEEPPARLHGDLWTGNVLWEQGGAAWLIDPAAYGGHREVDLAMLALFGLPHLDRALTAYQEAAPLADGWEDRIAVHQLFPLLVHAATFGGGYGERAAEAARSYD